MRFNIVIKVRDFNKGQNQYVTVINEEQARAFSDADDLVIKSKQNGKNRVTLSA